MKIRNRITDIKTLQAHILQDYFSMALDANFAGNTWKPIFRDEVQRSVNSLFSRSYIGAWEKMQLKGMDDYSIDDMDTTIITTILKGPKEGSFGCCKFNKINQYLDYLQDDRNIEAHTTGNENDSELLQWAYGSLHNISRFIAAVANAKDCKVPDDQRNNYARKYQAEIESLRLLFESDYKTAFTSEEIDQSIKRDIERIKNSKDSFRTYVEIHGQYTNKKNDEGKPDMLLCNRFMYAAADAGIVWAFPLIGDFHFEGLLTDLNFIKAAECYEKGFSQLTPPQKLRLASIYLNNLCGSSNKKEEGLTILKSCENPRWDIIKYKSKEGYEFYSLKKKEI